MVVFDLVVVYQGEVLDSLPVADQSHLLIEFGVHLVGVEFGRVVSFDVVHCLVVLFAFVDLGDVHLLEL